MTRAPISRLNRALVAGVSWRSVAVLAYQALLLGLLLWASQRSLQAVWPFTIDDSGISYAYAKHIAEGHGPVAVIGGPRVEGYSNPLWVFLLVPFHWLGWPLPIVGKILGVLLFALLLALGMALIRRARLPGERRGVGFGATELAFALALALCVEWSVWVVAGLENALFSALMLLLAWMEARESQDPKTFASSGLAAFALSITRPEGVLYAAPLVGIKLLRAYRDRAFVRQALLATALWLGPLALYQALHYLIFRQVLPNTYYAKPQSRDLALGYAYLARTLQESGLIYALPLALLGLWGNLRGKLLLLWDCIAGAAFVLYSGGDWMPHGRFVSFFVPALLVLGALGLSNLAHALFGLARRRLPRELLLLLVAGVPLWLWSAHQLPRLARLERQPWCHFCERLQDTRRLQELSRQAALTTYSLVTHDFGGPAWLSDESFYPLDFMGLCDQSMAKIRGEQPGPGGKAAQNLRLYQYLLHEQPTPPSWVYVPPNFWRGFDLSPEYRWGYFRLSPKLLPKARADAFFGLHRSELVDYFPPLPRFEFRSLTSKLTLLGSESHISESLEGPGVPLAPGASLSTRVSILPRGKLVGGEALALRIEADGGRVESEPQPIARGLEAVARQLEAGDPLSFEFSLLLPPGGSSRYRLSLGVSSPASGRTRRANQPSAVDWTWVPLGELASGALLPAHARTLPRYPQALPAPLQPELRRLREPVTLAIERRRRDGNLAAVDSALAARLLALGAELDRPELRSQAYLAYVWATQVDRGVWPTVVEQVFRLRQHGTGDAYATELLLLRHYYAQGTSVELARLIGFYLSEGRVQEAAYFFERRPGALTEPELWAALELRLRSELGSSEAPGSPAAREQALSSVAVDPLGGALDFETEHLEGWVGDAAAFRVGKAALAGAPTARGQHGGGILSSLASGNASRGRLESPEFTLEGRVLSLLIGGGGRAQKAGVELVVDDQVVKSAQGNGSDFMYPELWDISAHQGKRAKLRVFDADRRSHVLVDRVLAWR
jgi:hypothetical protein